jgi:signal transduction histidine kinase
MGGGRFQLSLWRSEGITTVVHAVARTILQERQIACAVTDAALLIVEVADPGGIVPEYQQDCRGRLLTEIMPELVGHEETLIQIVVGELPRFQVPWINRGLPDGQAVYLTMLFLPHRDETGSIVGLLHIVQDVTEIAHLEQAVTQQCNELLLARDQLTQQNARLRASDAELQRLDEIKSSFVAIAAHELRTPLTAIMGYLELLSGGDAGSLNDAQMDCLRTAEAATHRLLRITNNLLDVTRLEAGRLELLLQPTDLAALVAAVATEQASLLEAKAQRLSLQTSVNLPPALCDAVRAGQIIGNLINNAGKFAPPDSTIDVRLSVATEPGYLRVSVTDQGVGISPENHAMLFKPFGRINGAEAAGTDGAGLGLFIARSLVDLHGGRIWYENLLGEGITFHVNFPIADQTPPE